MKEAAKFALEASKATLMRSAGSMYCIGAMFDVLAYGTWSERLEAAISDALGEAKRLDGLLSNYSPESELNRVNRLGSGGPMTLSSEPFQFLSVWRAHSRSSEGTFGITVGPLMKAWGFYNGTGRLPQHDEVVQASNKSGLPRSKPRSRVFPTLPRHFATETSCCSAFNISSDPSGYMALSGGCQS